MMGMEMESGATYRSRAMNVGMMMTTMMMRCLFVVGDDDYGMIGIEIEEGRLDRR